MNRVIAVDLHTCSRKGTLAGPATVQHMCARAQVLEEWQQSYCEAREEAERYQSSAEVLSALSSQVVAAQVQEREGRHSSQRGAQRAAELVSDAAARQVQVT